MTSALQLFIFYMNYLIKWQQYFNLSSFKMIEILTAETQYGAKNNKSKTNKTILNQSFK